MPKKIYKIEIEPLTGVHIGTGETLTPMDYTVVPIKNNKEMYLKFSSDRILDRLISQGDDLKAFYTASDNRDMKAMRDFFHAHISIPGDIEYPCDVTAGFSQVYARNKNKDPLENASEVLQMYRPASSNKPVIPGSSLKGAIRTAILNILLSDLSKEDFDEQERLFNIEKNKTKFESALQHTLLHFNDPKNDPFRTILIEDVAFSAKNTQLVGLMKNIAASNDELVPLQLQIQAEILRGTLIGGAAKAEAHLIIDESLQKVTIEKNEYTKSKGCRLHKHIAMDEIAEACNKFFWDEFDSEYRKFYKAAYSGTDIITELRTQLDEISVTKGCFIIRLGRWSQLEFVTFEETFREPKVSTRYGKSWEESKTRTVFDYNGEYVPLGWCKCTYTECK